MTKVPDRLNIDKADRELYDHDAMSEIFEGKTRKEQFLFAMAMGFKNQVKRSLESKEGFFLAKDMNPGDEALIDAVAIHDSGPDVLANREEVFRIAEEYAHAGIRLLYDRVTSSQPGSFYKRFEIELFDLLKALERD
ncbi:MAG: hypothetical protein QXI12_05425 [Candidatus Methanomethyliaceae archaeon]